MIVRTKKAQGGNGKVRIVCGANSQEARLAGITIAEARSTFAQILNIDPEARALIGGEEASESQVLRPGDQVEFIRESGRKG